MDKKEREKRKETEAIMNEQIVAVKIKDPTNFAIQKMADAIVKLTLVQRFGWNSGPDGLRKREEVPNWKYAEEAVNLAIRALQKFQSEMAGICLDHGFTRTPGGTNGQS